MHSLAFHWHPWQLAPATGVSQPSIMAALKGSATNQLLPVEALLLNHFPPKSKASLTISQPNRMLHWPLTSNNHWPNPSWCSIWALIITVHSPLPSLYYSAGPGLLTSWRQIQWPWPWPTENTNLHSLQTASLNKSLRDNVDAVLFLTGKWYWWREILDSPTFQESGQ